jgi:hypothetical protein
MDGYSHELTYNKEIDDILIEYNTLLKNSNSLKIEKNDESLRYVSEFILQIY